MPKYKVECQTIVELEIEADSQEDAEQLAGIDIIEHCIYNADSMDWCISAHEVNK